MPRFYNIKWEENSSDMREEKEVSRMCFLEQVTIVNMWIALRPVRGGVSGGEEQRQSMPWSMSSQQRILGRYQRLSLCKAGTHWFSAPPSGYSSWHFHVPISEPAPLARKVVRKSLRCFQMECARVVCAVEIGGSCSQQQKQITHPLNLCTHLRYDSDSVHT